MKFKMNAMVVVLFMGMLLFTIIPMANTFAQDAPVATASEAKPTGPKTKTFLDMILSGGPFMIPLGMCSVAVVALVIRNFMIFNRDKLLRPDLLAQIEQLMAEGDIHSCMELCRSYPSILTAVVEGGLERIVTDEINPDTVKQGFEQAGRSQMTRYIKAINYLSNIGAVSPMLGLLGTVSGMIKAFQNLSLGAAGGGDAIAGNIGEALMTTATGLVIAIPAMLFYFYFKNNFAETMSILGQYIGKLSNALETGAVSGNIATVETKEV